MSRSSGWAASESPQRSGGGGDRWGGDATPAPTTSAPQSSRDLDPQSASDAPTTATPWVAKSPVMWPVVRAGLPLRTALKNAPSRQDDLERRGASSEVSAPRMRSCSANGRWPTGHQYLVSWRLGNVT